MPFGTIMAYPGYVVFQLGGYKAIAFKNKHNRKVQVGNDQENAQPERNSHSKNRGGEN